MRLRYLAVLAILVAACNGGGPKTKIAGMSANDHGTMDVTGMTSLEIEAHSYYFEPTVLKGTPGQHVTLSIKNATSGTQHNFTVKSQHVNQDMDPTKTYTVKVTLPPSGAISFFCEYHHQKGMAGGLQSS